MEMLKMRVLKENKNKAITRLMVDCAKPIKERLTAFRKKARVNGIRVSNRETSHPEIGKPIMELMGMVRRTEPNSASFKSRAALMVGMREAQLAKLNPERKKNMLRKMRCLTF